MKGNEERMELVEEGEIMCCWSVKLNDLAKCLGSLLEGQLRER